MHRRESNTVWRCWRSVVNTELLYRTRQWSSSVHLTLFPDETCDCQWRHWSCLGRNVQQLATVRSQLQPHTCGIVCRRLLISHRRCLISEENWKRNSICALIPIFNCIVVLQLLILRNHYSNLHYITYIFNCGFDAQVLNLACGNLPNLTWEHVYHTAGGLYLTDPHQLNYSV